MIVPSILAADLSRLAEECNAAVAAGASILHFDVMDNRFVPNLSFGPSVCHSIIRNTSALIDLHLMAFDVDSLISSFLEDHKDRFKMLSFHPEATIHLRRILLKVKSLGLMVGLAINPGTSLNVLDYVLDDLDYVLLMTVDPGFSGQSFIPAMFEKLKRLRSLLDEYERYRGRRILVEVDGGVTLGNASKLVSLGADILVVGSSFFSSGDYSGVFKIFSGFAAG